MKISFLGIGALAACTVVSPKILAGSIAKAKLSTGLEIVLLEDHKVPLSTIYIACKAGAMTETPESNGLTHLWEHMFFKGNGRLPDQEAFDKRVRQLGIKDNGNTGSEFVRYFLTLPSVYTDEGIQFMADAISTPLLEQKELERERKIVQDEYDRNASDPLFDARNLSDEIIYRDQAYRRTALGLRPIIDKASREQLLQIKNDVFVPANCALLAAGDIKMAAFKKSAEKHFSNWKTPKGWTRVKRPAFPPFPKTTEFVMVRPLIQTPGVMMTFQGPLVTVAPEDTYTADVLSYLLNHQGGQFYKTFIDSGLALSASCSYYTQAEAGEVNLSGSAKAENIVKLKAALLAAPKDWMKPDYFTATQLADVKRSLLIEKKRDMNKPSSQINHLAFSWVVTGLAYDESYILKMSRVTIADVRKFVKKYLIDKPYVSAMTLSPDDAKIAGVIDNSSSLVETYLKPRYGQK